MDPLATVDYAKDTTYAFMLGAHAAGHEVFYLPAGGITLEGNRGRFAAVPVVPHDDPEHLFDVSPGVVLSDDDVDVIFIRNNPPFDAHYLMNTWLLDPLTDRMAIINSPAAIRSANEKLWAMQFPDLMPPTLVTQTRNEFDRFLKEHGTIVTKPTDGFGGQGVFILHQEDPNALVVFETLSENETRHIILQGLVPEAIHGDKRILLLDGEILGAVLRVHGENDHRNNFFAGGHAVPTELTERDREIAATLKPYLVQQELHFVGIDVLGDALIEVNVTSPTCLQEINRITGRRLEQQVIAFAEALASRKHRSTV